MAAGIEVAATAIIALGFVLTCVSVAIPYWEQSDPDDTFNDNIIRHKGIWMKCTSYTTGNWECDDYNSFFLGLPAMLQAARGFSITAILLGIVGTIAMILGMDGVPCGSDNKSKKKRTRLIAGALAIIGGFCIIAAASWYGNYIRLEYDIQTALKLAGKSNVNRTVFGTGLFVGWGGGVLMFIGGLIALCTGCGDSDDDNTRTYAYRPPTNNRHSEEYV